MRATLAIVVASLALALAWSPEPTQVCQKAASQAQHYATCSCPYVWGGTSCGCGGNGGMDCSGLVYRSYNDAGWSGILRTAAQQYTQGQSCKPGCSASNPSACSVGDLFFYCFSQPCPDHVVMYIGNGQVAECPHTGENCHVITPYATSFQGCKSICNGQPSTTSTSGTTSPSGSGSGSGPSGSGSGSGSSKPPSGSGSGSGSSKPPSGSGSGSGSSKPPSSGTTTTASSGGSKTSASSATTKGSSLNAASAGHQSTNGHSASAAANTASAGHANAASAGTNANTASGNAASGNNNAASGGSNANAASGNAASGNSGSSATGPSRGRLYR